MPCLRPELQHERLKTYPGEANTKVTKANEEVTETCERFLRERSVLFFFCGGSRLTDQAMFTPRTATLEFSVTSRFCLSGLRVRPSGSELV